MNRLEKLRLIEAMYFKENMTAKQIADEMGLSINTIKKYLSARGMRKSTFIKDTDRIKATKNKKYKKLSREELRKLLIEDQAKMLDNNHI